MTNDFSAKPLTKVLALDCFQSIADRVIDVYSWMLASKQVCPKVTRYTYDHLMLTWHEENRIVSIIVTKTGYQYTLQKLTSFSKIVPVTDEKLKELVPFFCRFLNNEVEVTLNGN